MTFAVGDQPAPLPPTAAAAFATRSKGHPSLSVRSGLLFCCHFFAESEIEMDIDPREVHDDASLARLFTFMTSLSDELGKPIVLTPENEPDRPVFSCEPREGRVYYHPDA